jgi:hypothetical protein
MTFWSMSTAPVMELKSENRAGENMLNACIRLDLISSVEVGLFARTT